MKKFLVVTVAALCCLAFTAPAFAEVKVEGMIQSDFYYWSQSKERVMIPAAGTNTQFGGLPKNISTLQESYDTTRINMPQPLNRLSIRYTGEDKVVNGYIQLRAGGARGTKNGVGMAQQTTFANAGIPSESAFSWEYAWIDWHINPNLYFRFGRQDQTFANAYAPAQGLGWNDGHIIGLGFGNISAQSRDAVRAFIRFTDNVRMEIEALDPNSGHFFLRGNTPALAINGQVGTANAGALESNTIPRFDISLPIKIANFTIEPGFTWHENKFQQVDPGNDDSFTSWGATLGASAAFGPLSFMGEFTYGQNIGGNGVAGYWGAANGQPAVYIPRNATNTANVVNTSGLANQLISDGQTLAWFVQGAFNFGPAAIQLIYGQNRGWNNGDPGIPRDVSEWNITQKMYGINFPIFITKTFTITPSVWYYDYDRKSQVGSGVGAERIFDTDLGSEITGGVTFQLVF